MQDDLPQPETPAERSIMLDPIRTLHSPAPVTVSPETSLAEVIRRMRAENVGYTLVVDQGRLVGIFTERDLLLKVAGQTTELASIPVSRLMTRDPAALKATEPIKHALFLMAHNGFRHIPLNDEAGHPIGITTVRHVVEYLEGIAPAQV
jgi:CBS domain-containing protein